MEYKKSVKKTETTLKLSYPYFTIAFNILFIALSYFVYGKSFDMSIAFVIIIVLYDFAAYLSLIPLLGVFFQGIVMYFWFTPFVENLTGLYNTWLLNLIFWLDISVGAFLSLIMIIVIIA